LSLDELKGVFKVSKLLLHLFCYSPFSTFIEAMRSIKWEGVRIDMPLQELIEEWDLL